MEIKEYRCPNCGGALEYNDSGKKMKCPYCDSEFWRQSSGSFSREKPAVPAADDYKSAAGTSGTSAGEKPALSATGDPGVIIDTSTKIIKKIFKIAWVICLVIIWIFLVLPSFGIDVSKYIKGFFDKVFSVEYETVLDDAESTVFCRYQASDINDKPIEVSFYIRYVWSSEKEALYENNIQVEDYIKIFFQDKDVNYAFIEDGTAKGSIKSSIVEEWGGPILLYMRDLFSDESIDYYRSSRLHHKFYVWEIKE